MEFLVAQILSGVSLGGQYALIAIGYTMVYGILRLINFAHGDVFLFPCPCPPDARLPPPSPPPNPELDDQFVAMGTG